MQMNGAIESLIMTRTSPKHAQTQSQGFYGHTTQHLTLHEPVLAKEQFTETKQPLQQTTHKLDTPKPVKYHQKRPLLHFIAKPVALQINAQNNTSLYKFISFHTEGTKSPTENERGRTTKVQRKFSKLNFPTDA